MAKYGAAFPAWAVENAPYYLNVASMVSGERKRCYSRTVGAILVRDDQILTTGFNGPPRGVPMCDKWGGNWMEEIDALNLYDPTDTDKPYEFKDSGDCPKKVLGYESGHGLEFCPASHAEQNCVALAAKAGTSTKRSYCYVTSTHPCKECVITLLQAGVIGIFCEKFNNPYDTLGLKLLAEANVPLIMVEKENGKFVNKIEQFVSKKYDKEV